MDENQDAKASNYMASVTVSSFEIVILYAELSTGELKYQTLERSLVSLQKALLEQEVCEVICPLNLDKRWKQALEEMGTCTISYQKKTEIDPKDLVLLSEDASDVLKMTLAQLMGYLKETQKQHIDHFYLQSV